MSTPLHPAIDRVAGTYVGVADFGPTVEVLRDGFGWSVTDFDDIPPPDSARLWGVAAAAEVLALAPGRGCPGGTIDLLRFPGLEVPSVGAPSMACWGQSAISVYAKDIDALFERAVRAGARVGSEPKDGKVPRGGGTFAVTRGGRLVLPGDLNVLVVQTAEPRPVWAFDAVDCPSSEINFLLYRSPEIDRVIGWWGEEGLGLPVAHATPIGGPALAHTYGVAPGLRMTNGITGNVAPGRLELQGPHPDDQQDRADPAGYPDIRADQWPGRSLGAVLWRIVLPEAPESFPAWSASRGAEIVVPPERCVGTLFGNRAVGILRGPDGQRVQVEVPLP